MAVDRVLLVMVVDRVLLVDRPCRPARPFARDAGRL
jgi:hypothetical protein